MLELGNSNTKSEMKRFLPEFILERREREVLVEWESWDRPDCWTWESDEIEKKFPELKMKELTNRVETPAELKSQHKEPKRPSKAIRSIPLRMVKEFMWDNPDGTINYDRPSMICLVDYNKMAKDEVFVGNWTYHRSDLKKDC